MDSKQHMENVWAKRIRPLFEKAAERIDALKPGEKVPATELAKEVGKSFGMTGPQAYPILKLFFDNYPGVTVKRGAHGGIEKNQPVALTAATVQAIAASVAASVATVLDTATVDDSNTDSAKVTEEDCNGN